MDDFIYRNATIHDIPFLVNTIIEAEKSGTNILTYTSIFGIPEEQARIYLADMLLEEIDNCELSISSFLLAEFEGKVIAAVAAWIEAIEGTPSSTLKGNLLKYVLPRKAIERALSVNSIVSDIHIEYIPNSIQIGLVYVTKEFRGQNLVRLLIDKQIENLLKRNTEPTAVYVQVFANNLAAIKAYEKANFRRILSKESSHDDTLMYMPSYSKILMKRDI